MRETETVTQEETVITKYICDLCGSEGGAARGWGKMEHKRQFTAVYLSDGDFFPNDWIRKDTYFDICAECFLEKLVPWMDEQGALPAVEELEG